MLQTIDLQLILTPEQAGKRLDQALAEALPDFSRSRIKTWIDEGHVLVNGHIIKPREKILGGEQVDIKTHLTSEVRDCPENLPLDVIAEDEHFLVINKPAALTVHPGAGNPHGTLVNALLHHYPDLHLIPRAGIVHRLDKDTTGLMVIAKTLCAHTSFVNQLQERTVKRTYQTVVGGTMTAGGSVNAPIARHPKDRIKMAVVSNGKKAITHFRVLQKFRAHTHVQVQLETGRTHQIRVHMAHIHHPVVGDKVYGGRFKLPPKITPQLQLLLRDFPRQALHACRLGFLHPVTHEYVEWQASPPDDIVFLLNALKQDFLEHSSS